MSIIYTVFYKFVFVFNLFQILSNFIPVPFDFDLCFNPGNQLLLIKGFYDIINSTEIKSLYNAFCINFGSKKYYRDFLFYRITFNGPAYFETVHTRHHYIEKNKIKISPLNPIQS